jgi:FKBP-type peptidyl-prolyl cis-trans isomerase
MIETWLGARRTTAASPSIDIHSPPLDLHRPACRVTRPHRTSTGPTVGCSVTAVNSSRVYSAVALAACVAATLLPLAGKATAAGSCPTAAPQNGGAPDWSLAGNTGSIAVTGSTDTTAPRVNVAAPFSVTQTQVHTLHAGDGPVVPGTARVSVCYMGVNGRDGSVFDSSYERGAPVDFPLGGVVPGFQKAIAGQNVGSTVAVAMTSADGYPDGQPSAGIRPGDTLIFAIKVLSASS